MKKLFSIILVTILLICSSVSFAEAVDYSTMDDATLHAMIDAARNELTKRELVAGGKTVLFEQDGVTLYLTGEYKTWGSDTTYVEFEAVVINDSEYDVFVSVESAYINGWEVYGSGMSDTAAGKKQKGSVEFSLTDADISTFEEIEEIEISFRLVDTETYDAIAELEPITVHFNAAA